MRAGEPGGLLLELTAQQTLELIETLETEALGEIVVDLGLAFDLHLLDDDRELRVLAL